MKRELQKNFMTVAEGGAGPQYHPKVDYNEEKERRVLQEIQRELDSERLEQEQVQKKQKDKYLPLTLTEELEQHKENLVKEDLHSNLEHKKRTLMDVKEAVLFKLGGEFNYDQFQFDLKQLKRDREALRQAFKVE